MTTTACDDQLNELTERHITMYSIVPILRRNVADLEIALRKQTERAEAAEAELEAVREDNHGMMLEIDGLRTELAKRAREHQQEMTSFRLRVRSQDDATFAALREENERLRENAKIISELEQLAARSNNDLLVENERLKPLSSWHPMRTAPRDGTKIVVLGNNYGDKEQGTHICIASCIDGLFYHENDDIGMNVDSGFFLEHLTHWMPLPEPPK